MTKEAAIKLRDQYHKDIDSPVFVNYVIGAWITNKQGTDDWFVDVAEYNPHINDDKYYFYMDGF